MILNIKKVVITMNRVVIIGSGPSGLFCALNAKKEDNEVIVLEKKDSFGKKILVMHFAGLYLLCYVVPME